MNEEKITMVDQIAISMTKPREYFKLTKLKTGKTVGFLIIFAFILAFIRFGVNTICYIVNIGGFEKLFMETMPDFTYSDGVLKMDDEFTMDVGNVTIYVNTDIENITLDDVIDNDGVYVAIGSKNLLMGIVSGSYTYEYMNYTLDTLVLGSFDNEGLCSIIPAIYTYLIIWFFGTLLFAIVKMLFMGLVFTIVGTSVSKHFESGLSFGNVFRVCVYAQALPFFVMEVNRVLDYLLPAGLVFAVFMFVIFGYINKGIMSHVSMDIDLDNDDEESNN